MAQFEELHESARFCSVTTGYSCAIDGFLFQNA